jgi:FtsP/CotA-like multicopper oxidase with cupredoxin domain
MNPRRLMTFVLIPLTISILATSAMNVPPQAAASSTPTIALIGFVNAWNFSSSKPNPTITVTQGDTLTIQLSSGDGAPHRFFLDVDRNGPTADCPGADVCSSFFPPSSTFSFTVNFIPGTYTYYCSVHPGSMFGFFVVLSPLGASAGGRRIPN